MSIYLTFDSNVGHQTSTQTMDVDMVFSSSLSLDITLWQHGSQIPTWPQVVTRTTDLFMALSGDRIHRHQHRPP